MNVLIIGSKGFIGERLASYFHEVGYKVYGADVIVDYVNKDSYFLIDSSNSDYASVFQAYDYDLCVNCSGAASVPDSFNNSLRDYYLNTVNVYKILQAIKIFQPECKFVNLSSAAVYGNPEYLPIKESAKISPLSPYGIHKFQSEQICREFYTFWNIRTCSLRIFSVYGDGLKKQLFWDLYNKAQSGKPLVLYGTGNESRDYIYIEDLVRVIEIVNRHSDFKSDIINVANGEQIKIKNAVDIFYSYFNRSIKYSFSGIVREGDPQNWRSDISKLKSFGYTPSIDIKQGLKFYYDWLNKSFKL